MFVAAPERTAQHMMPEEAALLIIRRLAAKPITNETGRRELLIGHLGALFPEYQWQIAEYALGAERPVKTKPKKGKKPVAGRIDTRKGALLIEYKKNLSKAKQEAEAQGQLKEYVVGIVNKEGLSAVSKCLSTDILNWCEYEVSIQPVAIPGEITNNDIVLEKTRSYSFTETDAGRFVETVRRLIFEDVPLVATGQRLVEFFGLKSSIYLSFRDALRKVWSKYKKMPETQLGLRLWSEYIENCFEAGASPDEETYLDHVYLVILARMIAGSALATPSEQASEDFPARCITGELFSAGTHRVDRFVEEDFFKWAKNERVLEELKQVFEKLHTDLQKLDFRSAKKYDLFAELYQQIMPPEHRAEYGGVFTPSWLVKDIIEFVPDCGKIGVKVLDPACGTGSFLRAVIAKKLENSPADSSPQEVLNSVLGDITGLDINPISVVIAKTTLMLTLADWLRRSEEPVGMPVFLCDSLFLPEGFIRERGNERIIVSFDGTEIKFPSKLLSKGTLNFDNIVETSTHLAAEVSSERLTPREAERPLIKVTDRIVEELSMRDDERRALFTASLTLVKELARRIKERRNNVWAFVLKNTYRPSLLKAKFDIISSNLPWLAMSSFPTARYKRQLEKLIREYKLTPSPQSRHHMEIATVFATHCVAHYLTSGGGFAFVLPRVILNGDHHDPFRRSKFRDKSPMRVISLLDLERVVPLFGRPACVLFGNHDQKNAGIPEILPCTVFAGNPETGINKEKTRPLKLTVLGSKSSFDETTLGVSGTVSGYADGFRQGADIMPRRAVIVDIVGSKNVKILSIQTSQAEKANPNNKPPWDKIDLRGTIEKEYICTTLKSDSVLPFTSGKASYAALPVEKSESNFRLLTAKNLALKGHTRAKQWFENVDKKLMKAGGKNLVSWLSRKNKLTDQSSKGCAHLVLYGAGGTNICATITDTTKMEYPFVNDQTLYSWEAPSEDEAWYICGMLNSKPVNAAIKSKQPRGQFGEQHIHKLPLSLIPKFDENNPYHIKLAAEARRLSGVTVRLCKTNPGYLDVSKSLASRRKAVFKELALEMTKSNDLARKILKGGS